MLGRIQRRHYLNISGGKIVQRTESGRTLSFDFVEGILEGISQKDREFRGEKVPYWYIDLRDPQTGGLYSLGVGASSGVWRSLIRISPYKRGEYDRVSVHQGGERLDWVSDLPPVEEVEVSPGKRVKSVEKREVFISGIVQRINQTLQG